MRLKLLYFNNPLAIIPSRKTLRNLNSLLCLNELQRLQNFIRKNKDEQCYDNAATRSWKIRVHPCSDVTGSSRFDSLIFSFLSYTMRNCWVLLVERNPRDIPGSTAFLEKLEKELIPPEAFQALKKLRGESFT